MSTSGLQLAVSQFYNCTYRFHKGTFSATCILVLDGETGLLVTVSYCVPNLDDAWIEGKECTSIDIKGSVKYDVDLDIAVVVLAETMHVRNDVENSVLGLVGFSSYGMALWSIRKKYLTFTGIMYGGDVMAFGYPTLCKEKDVVDSMYAGLKGMGQLPLLQKGILAGRGQLTGDSSYDIVTMNCVAGSSDSPVVFAMNNDFFICGFIIGWFNALDNTNLHTGYSCVAPSSSVTRLIDAQPDIYDVVYRDRDTPLCNKSMKIRSDNGEEYICPPSHHPLNSVQDEWKIAPPIGIVNTNVAENDGRDLLVDRVDEICKGDFAPLAVYFSNVRARDLSGMTESDLMSIVSMNHRILLMRFIREKLSVFMNHVDDDPFASHEHEPVRVVGSCLDGSYGVGSTECTFVNCIAVDKLWEHVQQKFQINFSCITAINLSNNPLTDSDMEHVVLVITKLKNCRLVDLSNNRLRYCFDYMVELLRLEHVKFVDVTYNALASFDGRKFFEKIIHESESVALFAKLIWISPHWVRMGSWKTLLKARETLVTQVTLTHEAYFQGPFQMV